jgi:hypothetical protein
MKGLKCRLIGRDALKDVLPSTFAEFKEPYENEVGIGGFV